MRRSFGLTVRFIGLILIILTAMFTTIAVILIHLNTSTLRRDLQDRSKAFAALATTPIGNSFITYQDSGTFLIDKQMSQFMSLDPTISGIAIVDLSGTVQYKTGSGLSSVSNSTASSFNPVYEYSGGVISQIIYPYIADNGSHSYAVVYAVSASSINSAAHRLMQSIVLYSLAGLVVSALLIYVLMYRFLLRPIEQLRNQAMRIAAGDYSVEIPHDRHDEIGDLAQSTNQMANRLKADIIKLQESDQIKSEFMMIAAHNLRSPLSIIEGNLSLIEGKKLDKDIADIFDSISLGTKRLGHFAEDILTISSIESGQHLFKAEPFDCAPLLQKMADDFGQMARQKKITFKTDLAAGPSMVSGSPMHLRSALWNLMENAYKFTAENGKINLESHVNGSDLSIIIRDTGIGISAVEQERLFTKFHRGTSTLTYDYEGTGIGLYVTKLIIQEHEGRISVISELDKGTTFTIILPIAPVADDDRNQTIPGADSINHILK